MSAPVDVVRDAQGAPHIYASNQNDASFALGYIHASERMFQMDVFRRIPSGTVSELLGFPDFQTGPDLLHEYARASVGKSVFRSAGLRTFADTREQSGVQASETRACRRRQRMSV